MDRLKEAHGVKVASLKEKVRVLTEERDSRSESRDVLREELQVKLAAQEKQQHKLELQMQAEA